VKKPKTEPSCGPAGNQPSRCLVCAKLFRNQDSLDQHVQLQTDGVESGTSPSSGRPKSHSFRCDVCSKTFTWYYHQKQLTRVQKPFPCSECSMSFNKKERRALHFDVVHAKKSFQCPECSQTFPHLALFKTHVAVHVDRIMDHSYSKKNSQMFSGESPSLS
jgi:KRAB domain-containing zinc finger protein